MATTTARATRLAQRFRLGPLLLSGARRHMWLAPILLVAAWLRFTHLRSEFLYGDEAEYAIVARYLARDWLYLAYPAIEGMGAQPFVSQPPLVLYTMALSIRLFGATDLAAILPSVLFGIGTVIALYALGTRLGGRAMGLAAATLLAVLPFHVELSRKAMLDAGYVFFLVLTTYFLVAWVQDRRAGLAVGAGCAAAATALAKLPGVIVMPALLVVFAAVLGAALVRRRWSEARTVALHGAYGALPIAAGAGLYLLLLGYLEAVRNLWMKLIWQLGRVDSSQARIHEVTAVSREWSWYFTDPKFSFGALLGGTVLLVAVVGLGVLAVRVLRAPTREAHHLVPLAVAATLLAFFLYSERKEGFYLLPFAPFVALLVAYAVDGLRRAILAGGRHVAPLRPHAPVLAVALAVALLALPAMAAAEKSYGRYALYETQEKFFGSGTREAALYIREHDPDAGQYGTLLGRFTLHWYNEQTTYHWYVDHTRIEEKVRSGELRYIVYDDYLGLAFDREYMKDLIDRYNGQAVAHYRQGWGEVTVFELHP